MITTEVPEIVHVSADDRKITLGTNMQLDSHNYGPGARLRFSCPHVVMKIVTQGHEKSCTVPFNHVVDDF